MTWFQVWTVAWQVAVFVTPLMVGAAVLWLKAQFVTKLEARTEAVRIDAKFDTKDAEAKAEASRIDGAFAKDRIERDQRYEQLRDRISDHESRLRVVEADIAKPPTRHTLNNELTKVVAIASALEKGVSGLGRQIDTLHTYVHTIVEQGMQK